MNESGDLLIDLQDPEEAVPFTTRLHLIVRTSCSTMKVEIVYIYVQDFSDSFLEKVCW